jgi:putative spermidine/putrescine transport system substrate-binding protein
MGIKFNEEETSQGMARVQAMVQAHNVTDDVVTVDTAQVLAACDSGILVRLDWSKIAPRDGLLPGAARDCGMGLDVYGDILAYNTDVVKSDPPTSVLALFDTKRWPGKRGMQKIATNNLEWALEADGVPVDQVYKVLATKQGVDRAFAKTGHHQERHRLVAGRRTAAAVARLTRGGHDHRLERPHPDPDRPRARAIQDRVGERNHRV